MLKIIATKHAYFPLTTAEYTSNRIGTLFSTGLVALKRGCDQLITDEFQYSLNIQVLTDVLVAHLPN